MLEQSSTFITSTAIEHSSINRIAMLHVIKLLEYNSLQRTLHILYKQKI